MNLFRGILDNDSAFGQLMTRCGIIIACNLLFVLCTLPIVTIGAGWAAMDYCFLRTLRGDGILNPFKEFWQGFKSNFKQATLSWMVMLLLAAFLLLEWYWCGQFGGFFLTFRLALIMLLAIVALTAIYLFPTMAAFQASIPDLLKDSVFFAFKKPLNLVVILFFHIFPFILTYTDLRDLPLYAFIWCFFGFGAIEMLSCSLLVKEFIPYLPKVDAYGYFIDEEDLPDSPEEGETVSVSMQKSEKEILDEMKRLGM